MAVAALLLLAAGASASDEETLQRATDEAIGKIGKDLGKASAESVNHVAVIPLRGDADEYATSGLESAVTRTKFALFTRSEAIWDELLKEIEWGDRREDVMNPETVQKFGKIEGVDAILHGRIWDRNVNMWSVLGRVRMSVHLADVETGQIVWSSGPVEGAAYIHWSDAITQFWRYPLVLLMVLVVLVILALFVHRLKKAYRPLPSGRAD
jgi:hypothetical protein